MKTTYICAAKRTPIGSFQGHLSPVSATKLGSTVLKSLLTETKIPPIAVDECIMGQVLTAGTGQAPARQAALGAGLLSSTPCMTLNKVCGSGLKAIMLGHDSIQLGHGEIVMAGGQENMSQAPYLLPQARQGYRMGHQQTLDSMLYDGLWDPYHDFPMGVAAELCAKKYEMSREVQDQFAKESYTLSQEAIKTKAFAFEIVPVEVPSRKGSTLVDTDEEPGRARFDKIPTLKPAFEKDGTITAANASKINDGAAAVLLCSEKAMKQYKLTPLAKIVTHATFAQDPKWFTTAPIGAIKKALEKASLTVEDIDLWEINEAFSAVTIAAMKDLKIPREKVNVNGGAVAMGHPIGASGARIFTTLLHALKAHKKTYGLATLCIGGGEAVAVIVQNPEA